MKLTRWFACGTLCLATVWPTLAQDKLQERYRDERARMVQDVLVREGIRNPRVLQSMGSVPRHEFVDGLHRKQGYVDTALPIGHQQTISPPFVVAYMTETIDPQPEERVLEIGTGSGYQAAVLSGLAKEVYTIEIVGPLGIEAEKKLKKLGYSNVFCRVGDGYLGWPDKAPFHKIIVTCSPEKVPQPLIEQLAEGGKMIIPLGERYQQVFYLFEKQNGQLKPTKLIPTLFVPMTGKSEDLRDIKPDPAHPQLLNGSFELDANNDERPDNWHYQRQVERIKGEARDGDYYLEFTNADLGRPSQMLQGLAIDGRKVASVNLSMDVAIESVTPGEQPYEKPALVIHFYDSVRRPISDVLVGPFTRRMSWERQGRKIDVPKEAREAVLRVGLNGAIGKMTVDNVKLSYMPR